MVMFTAEQIRDMRLAMRLSMAQFAGKLGVGEHAVRRWELGERHPRFETMVKLNELKEQFERTQRNGRRKEVAKA